MGAFSDCSRPPDVVARFGDHRITLDEFRVGYLEILKQPNIFDSRELREQYLDELIRRKILAEKAKEQGMDTDEHFRYRMKAYRDKCLREVHYRKLIKPRIHVSEKELQEVFAYTREKRKLRQLFTKSKATADSLYRLLKDGASFDTLAEKMHSSSPGAPDRGDLGWVDWDQLEYDLAMAAFRLPVGSYSRPIKSRFGYHILKITDYQMKPLITRRDYEIHRRKTGYLMQSRIGEKLADEYLEHMMAGVHIQVYPGLVRFVGEKLAENLHRKPTSIGRLLPEYLRTEEVNRIETSLWEMRHEVVARIDGNPITVGELISALLYVPYDVIFWNYKKALDFAFRDYVLTREAIEHRYDRDPELGRKTRLYEEYLLQLKLRRKLVREVVVSEEEIRRYYQENRQNRFKNIEYDRVREIIKRQLLQEKRAKAVPEYLAGIMQGMKIEKNLAPIHAYYDQFSLPRETEFGEQSR